MVNRRRGCIYPAKSGLLQRRAFSNFDNFCCIYPAKSGFLQRRAFSNFDNFCCTHLTKLGLLQRKAAYSGKKDKLYLPCKIRAFTTSFQISSTFFACISPQNYFTTIFCTCWIAYRANADIQATSKKIQNQGLQQRVY
jgi:hypothetical protein